MFISISMRHFKKALQRHREPFWRRFTNAGYNGPLPAYPSGTPLVLLW